MVTKCIVLTKNQVNQQSTPIEFTDYVDDLVKKIYKWDKSNCVRPKDWMNIELIQNGPKHDIMFAYNKDRSDGLIYLGHWNDGVVE